MVTSIKWRPGELYKFSGTQDTGSLTLYDVRVSASVASQFIQRGLFDHTYLSDHLIACAGLGGVVHILDDRYLSAPAQTVLDPFLQDIGEFSVSSDGSMLAFGKNGITLWSSSGGALNFRGLQECTGSVRGSFIDSRRAITTESNGRFKEWLIKKPIKTHSSRALMPPYNDSLEVASPPKDSGVLLPSPNKMNAAAMETSPSKDPSLAEWDWDLDFNEWTTKGGRTPTGRSGYSEAESARAAAGQRETSAGQAEDLNVLPMKDLDDLIGYYLS